MNFPTWSFVYGHDQERGWHYGLVLRRVRSAKTRVILIGSHETITLLSESLRIKRFRDLSLHDLERVVEAKQLAWHLGVQPKKGTAVYHLEDFSVPFGVFHAIANNAQLASVRTRDHHRATWPMISTEFLPDEEFSEQMQAQIQALREELSATE